MSTDCPYEGTKTRIVDIVQRSGKKQKNILVAAVLKKISTDSCKFY